MNSLVIEIIIGVLLLGVGLFLLLASQVMTIAEHKEEKRVLTDDERQALTYFREYTIKLKSEKSEEVIEDEKFRNEMDFINARLDEIEGKQ